MAFRTFVKPLLEETSEIPWDALWISAKGFTTNPWPRCSPNLLVSSLNVPKWRPLLAMLGGAAIGCVSLEGEKCEVEFRGSVLLQNFGRKNSAPGSLQQVDPAESTFDILPVDIAKSYEISSSASSNPCTRVSRESIPFWELPMNFWRRNTYQMLGRFHSIQKGILWINSNHQFLNLTEHNQTTPCVPINRYMNYSFLLCQEPNNLKTYIIHVNHVPYIQPQLAHVSSNLTWIFPPTLSRTIQKAWASLLPTLYVMKC